jgi:nitrogen regulatory protein P-II 1
MKEIKAVIQPNRLARLREAFRRIHDFPGMTVSKAEGSGYHPDKPNPPGIKSELTEYSPKVRIELVVPDDEVARLVDLIHEICHTGRPGDGVVWVTPVETFRRLRERR